MNYEPYNYTTIRSFKGNELMCNEYYDGIHSGSLDILLPFEVDIDFAFNFIAVFVLQFG